MAKRRVMKEFSISEISAVDRPAQKGAKMTIMKRDASGVVEAVDYSKSDLFGDIVQKCYDYVSSYDVSPRTFTEIAAENEKRRRYWEAQEEIWPFIDALSSSLRSIVGAASLSASAKEQMIRTDVESFFEAVKDKLPEIEEELTKFFADPECFGVPTAGHNPGDHVSKTEKETDMTDNEKAVAELEKKLADVTGQLAKANLMNSLSDAERSYVKRLSGDEADRFIKMGTVERSALMKAAESNDEVVKVDGQSIRKSEVGEIAFGIIKKGQEDLVVSKKAAEIAAFTKRAEEELPNLPGEAVAKGEVLRAIETLDENVKKTLTAMLVGGNAAVGNNLDEVGKVDSTGKPLKGEHTTKAEAKLDVKAKEMAKAEKITYSQAYAKVMQTEPELYQEYLSERSAA